MAELTIHLRVDRDTQKKDVIIVYHSDEDALPLEHEDEHLKLVEKLLEGGLLQAGELGKIVVEREQSAIESARELTAERAGSASEDRPAERREAVEQES